MQKGGARVAGTTSRRGKRVWGLELCYTGRRVWLKVEHTQFICSLRREGRVSWHSFREVSKRGGWKTSKFLSVFFHFLNRSINGLEQ